MVPRIEWKTSGASHLKRKRLSRDGRLALGLVRNHEGLFENRAQAHAENVIGTGLRRLMHFRGDGVVSRHQIRQDVERDGHNLGDSFRSLV